jgi:CHAT domain-containing protein
LGKEHPFYAEILHRYARLIASDEDYLALEPLLREALEIQRRTRGTEHPEYAKLLTSLGFALVAQEEYESAEQLYRELVEIRRRTVGMEHPEYAEALFYVAGLLEIREDYTAAERLLRGAVNILRDNYGTEFGAYNIALDHLGRILYRRGDYRGAETFFRERKDAIGRTLGPDHPDYATALNYLGMLLLARGDFKSAETMHREALAIRARTVGSDHRDYAQSLHNLARTLTELDDHSAAIALYREALDIERRHWGTEHPVYAQTLNNLAMVLYLGEHDYRAAESLHREALEIRRRTLGSSHPEYAESLNNLAALLGTIGNYQSAEPLLLEVLRIQFRTLGENHPSTAYALLNLANINLMLGRQDSSLNFMERALETEQRALEQIFGFTSERGMLSYANTLRNSLSSLLSMTETQGSNAATEAALRWVLLRKGAVLSALSTYRQVERIAAADPEIASTIARLHDTRGQLTNLALNPPLSVAPDSLTYMMASLNTKREELEVGLSRALSARINQSDLLGAPKATGNALNLDELRRALPDASTLIEFVRYDHLDFGGPGRISRQPEHRYAALILRPTGAVHWVALGEATEVETAIRNLRDAHMGCEAGERSQFCSESNYRAAALEAYLQIFAPLEEYLEGSVNLIVSLDGELNQLPLGALVDWNDQYLIERYRIAYVSSGRDLLRAPGREPGRGTEIFAGPVFDLIPKAGRGDGETAGSPTAGVADHTDLLQAANAAALRARELAAAEQVREALRSMKWDELPGALAEADDVRGAIEGTSRGPVTVRAGADATEDAFKATRAPRILHLATHGFFIPERELTPEERARCITAGNRAGAELSIDLETGMGRGIERLRCAENPLLRSGIVLSGANAIGSTYAASARDGGAPGAASVASSTAGTADTGSEGAPPAVEDGWVLAEEIATLDLAGTELVVLSACETGLGDVKVGEGVYGLRRAFELAGAERILMSLYRVPDSATRELLAGFYHRLASGASPEEALRESQLELRERYPHPFYWASFVLTGTDGRD